MPGLDDIAHTYIFYLFKQPSNFTLQSASWDADRVYDPISVYARMNFSTSAVADIPGVGAPIAANYMRVQNPNTTAYGTASNGTCPSDSGLSGNGSSKGNVSTTGSPTAQVTESLAGRQAEWTASAGLVVLMSVAMALL